MCGNKNKTRPFLHITQRVTVQWPNWKRHDSVHPNITIEHEILDRSSEILTGKKATDYPIKMRCLSSGADMNAF